MIEAYRVKDVRRAEAAVLEALPDGELMRRAAQGLAQVVRARAEQRGARAVTAIVGSGDNGADALFALADLAESSSDEEAFDLTVIEVGATTHEAGAQAAQAAGVTFVDPGDDAAVAAVLNGAEIVLDGVLGIGGRPGLPARAESVRDLIPDGAYVIAVDLPSGADPEGEKAADCFWADESVTFSLVKPVHLLPPGEPACGLLSVVDIGVEPLGTPAVERLTRADIADRWPVPGPYDDKYSRGVVGLVVGSDQYPGAAVLSATAAVSAGAGMVRYVGPAVPTAQVAARVPEAVAGVGRVQAWVVGSGFSGDDRTPAGRTQQRKAAEALAEDVPCVVDAGGLDLLDGPRSAPTLLTPHAGELARLAKRLRPRGLPRLGRGDRAWSDLVAARPLLVAQAIADRLDATVLLKGSVTLVVPPRSAGLPVRSQSDGPAWLATAGSGDVLAGLAGMLLAAGLGTSDAGAVAAAVHGYAGHRVNPGGPVRSLALAEGLAGTVAHLLSER